MRPLRPLLGSFIAALVSLAAACGGKVVVDAPSGGAGGAGGADVTSTSSGPTDLCAQLCSFWSAVACPMTDCTEQCAGLFQEAGPCTAKLTDAIQCILDHPNEASMCLMPGSCTDAVGAYQDCVAPAPPPCDDETCLIASGGGCQCTSQCTGSFLEVTCASGTCSCSIDGSLVGSCADNGTTCSVTASCCAAFFFPQGK